MIKSVLKATLIIAIIGLTVFSFNTDLSCKKRGSRQSINEPEYLENGFSDKYDPLDGKNANKFKSSYILEKNTSFKGWYGIKSGFKKRSKYHIVALSDYQQVPIILENDKKEVHSFSLKLSEKKILNFKTLPLKSGFHDFDILVFKDLNKHDTSSDFRLQGGAVATGIRTNLIIGKQKSFNYPFSKFSATAYSNKVESDLLVNQEKETLDMPFKVNVKAGKQSKFYIHLANKSKHKRKYALLAFLDSKQIAIQGKKVIFTNVEQTTRLVVPLNIKVDEKFRGSIGELTIMSVISPGLLMGDKKNRTLPEYDEDIYFSNRISLVFN